MNAVVDHATQAGATVLTAVGVESEGRLPFGIVEQLLQSAFSSIEDPDLLPFSLREEVVRGDCSDKFLVRLVQGLSEFLLKAARERTVLIAIDDVHLADAQSLQVLLCLIARMRWVPVMVLLTEGVRRDETYARFRVELFRQPHCRRIRLGSLGTESVADLLSGSADADLVPEFARVSGGNPLLLHALIEDSTAVPGKIAGVVAGDAFAHATLACLRRDSRLLGVVRALAVAGRAAEPELLARLADVAPDDVRDMIELANQSGLLESGWFRHAIAQSSVLDDLLPRDLNALHLKAATLLHDRGAEAAKIADHLVATQGPVPEWAVAVLAEAADRALADDDVERAVVCFELALSACADATRRAELTAELVRTQWRVNPSSVARHLPSLRAALVEGTLPAHEGAQLVRRLLWLGQVDEAVETLNWLGEKDRAGDGQVREELVVLHQWLCCVYPDLAADGRAAAVVPAPAQPVNLRLAAASVLTGTLRTGASEALVNNALQVLQNCPLRDTTVDSITAALWALVFSDRTDIAAPWCEKLVAEATTRRARTWQAILTAIQAEIAVRQGDMAAAEKHGRAALELLSPKSWGVAIGSPLSSLMIALTTTSRSGEALEQLKWVVPKAMLRTRFGLQYRHARGQFYLITNRLHAALAEFRTCGELVGRWGLDASALLPWRIDVAETLLRLGQGEDALATVREQLDRPGLGARVRGNSLRVLAAAQEPKERLRVLRQAVDLLKESGDRYGLALALAELSSAHHEQGNYGPAKMMARYSTQVAKEGAVEELCARLLPGQADPAAAADEEEDAERVDALSDAERRVAELAAMGYTNREIARKVFVTVSTVEQHLTRAYRKLAVRNRNDLALVVQSTIADGA